MTQVIFVYKDLRDLSPPIRLQVVFVQKVVIVHLEPPAHHGALMEISIYSKVVRTLLIVNNVGVGTIAKVSRF